MSVFDLIKEALRIARAHKSLWLFGFLVGLGGNFNFGGGGGQPPVPPAAPVIPPDPARVVLVIIAALAVIAVFVVLRFIATGALIEVVKRARRNSSMTVREGFRQGWAHWGVLFRVALLSLPLILGSVLVLGRRLCPRLSDGRHAGRSRCRRRRRARGRPVAADVVHVAGLR